MANGVRLTTSPRSGLGGIKSVGHLNEFECGDDGCMGVLVELERGVVVATGGLEVVAGEDVVVAATGLVAGGPTAAGSSGAVELAVDVAHTELWEAFEHAGGGGAPAVSVAGGCLPVVAPVGEGSVGMFGHRFVEVAGEDAWLVGVGREGAVDA